MHVPEQLSPLPLKRPEFFTVSRFSQLAYVLPDLRGSVVIAHLGSILFETLLKGFRGLRHYFPVPRSRSKTALNKPAQARFNAFQLRDTVAYESALNPQGRNNVKISPLQEFTDLAQFEPQITQHEYLLQLQQIR
jgi:hypothetical protein